ncbi:3-beta hydroxysteroid dehydrogenase/isomerase [Corchorus capsularis]|uniref:3-beta hydroxysteroid dehydrogenase/isomerase n=1 Tax=Corchorus capsularis TaxID=210143 RepID=A0A1R3JNS5_COCAP|nr:3-beta hydroxysteroid dehydrogenase/isomerase [Corchorus capsularis]
MEEVAIPQPLLGTVLGKEKKCFGNVFSSSLSARDKKLICVTSGNSYLGSRIVKELLARNYLVRLTIQHEAEFEDLKQVMGMEELNRLQSVVVAKMKNVKCLCDAFRGCHAVFHTSSFIDPHGISGYSEQMAFLETEAARNVMDACAKAAYIKRCIFTSSLLTSIWTSDNIDRTIDESCWSSEEFCRENKLWLALGKTKAEKVAWMKARELKVKLVTICPPLLMAPTFPNAHQESSRPYLKGGRIMLQQGYLAVADVKKVAEAHVHIYEAMDYGACGRYLCFERVIRKLNEAIELENGLKMQGALSGERHHQQLLSEDEYEGIPSKISNSKLATLLFQASQRLSCKNN